ncbi:hypothetical protein BDV23DRAFT_184309 [Aspergillus alliaceus]|uniref:Uncharacterized protein n=1 Tax=Petromyces alliaceus TaxID=209559 RepID=A0A5N7C610_PETAA|nr:uncharacterized protein BDW43DRAFT_305881 [Aspergillus alliaceus]KAB8238995.1 hypothetical protein BDW43DRAFT_305881 [Aspergillus alliaceus]KAE8389551.1 hypothetical protein BDV23DRAFT_184309 [Aspergillus alliaceus]
MTSNYNTRQWANRVRAKDDENVSQKEDQQGGSSPWEPTKQYTAPSQSAGGRSQPADASASDPSSQQQPYSSKYHFTHDELAHPDE